MVTLVLFRVNVGFKSALNEWPSDQEDVACAANTASSEIRTCIHRWPRVICGWPWFLVLLFGLSLGCDTSKLRSGEGNEHQRGQRVFGLNEGWVLVSGSDAGDFTESIPGHRWQAFDAKHTTKLVRGDVSALEQSTRVLAPDTHYWIYVFPDDNRSKATPQLPASVGQLVLEGAQLVYSTQEANIPDRPDARVYTWDIHTQAAVERALHTLSEGEPYWVLTVTEPPQARSLPAAPSSDEITAADAQTNYANAGNLRESLYDPRSGAQREYAGDPSNQDSAHLSKFERVWTYTQGIALAQYARQDDGRAAVMANFLCEHAVSDVDDQGKKTILGWPFSWNTYEDDWADARLVTGANAWAIHGLGSYIVSSAFRHRPSEEKRPILDCYLAALRGLRPHRRAGLMTAGYTTLGLQNATQPSRLSLESDSTVEWSYYDILDAIGYDSWNADATPPTVRRLRRTSAHEPSVIGKKTLDADVFRRLRERVKANNVVTEHNLDVLSVLNHAISHWPVLSAGMSTEDQRLIQELAAWRDHLHTTIFDKLWDPTQGRFITGGHFVDGVFEANAVTAIDNCTWLTLSVEHQGLGDNDTEKLAQCLEYTLDRFVKELWVDSERYWGAFYFPNSFSDPYVNRSDAQEELYHLEATAGLILALWKFADAHKGHDQAAELRAHGQTLFWHMNRFVRDHGFPYSSRRIQDLMTELQSSTAAIWFVDTHDYYLHEPLDPDRPLLDYHIETDFEAARAHIHQSWEALRARAHGFENSNGIEAILGERDAHGLRGPSYGFVDSTGAAQNLRVRLYLIEDGKERLATNIIRSVPGAPPPPVTEITDSPLNRAWIEVYARAEKRPPDDLRALINPFGIFDEIHFEFHGHVIIPENVNSHRVMLSAFIDGEEWFIAEPDIEENGTFRFSYREGDAGYPHPKAYRAELLIPSVMMLDTEPVARLIDSDGQVVAVSMPPTVKLTASMSKISRAFPPNWGVAAHAWAFHGRHGGQHRIEVVDVSGAVPKSVASLHENDLPSGFVVSRTIGTGSQQRSVTLIEDQALAILAASKQVSPLGPGHRVLRHEDEWLRALLSTVQSVTTEAGENFVLFPYAVDSETGEPLGDYYPLSAQLWALYALAKLHSDGVYRKRTRDALVADVFWAVTELYGRDRLRPLLSAVGNPIPIAQIFDDGVNVLTSAPESTLISTVLRPVRPFFALEDHLVCDFAVRELSRTFGGDHGLGNRCERAIEEHFWDSSDRGHPIAYLRLQEDGSLKPPKEGADPSKSAALYHLFARNQLSETMEARSGRSLELLANYADGPHAQRSLGNFSAFADSPLLGALSLRAGTHYDPRLDALAWNEAKRLLQTRPLGAGELAGLQLLELPEALLNYDYRGPLVMALGRSAFRPEFDFAEFARTPSRTEVWNRLRLHYFDAFGALLMSDVRPHAFDILLRRMVQLRFVWDQVRSFVPPAQWPRRFLEQGYESRLTAHLEELKGLCQGFVFLDGDELSEQFLGLPCTHAVQALEKRIKGRTKDSDIRKLALGADARADAAEFVRWAQLVSLQPAVISYPGGDELLVDEDLDAPSEEHEVARSALVSLLGEKVQFGSLDRQLWSPGLNTSYRYLESVEQPLDLEQSPELLRDAWVNAVTQAQNEDDVWMDYVFHGIDLIDADNPAAPEYWTRPAIEFRTLLTLDTFLGFEFGGIRSHQQPSEWLYANPEDQRETEVPKRSAPAPVKRSDRKNNVRALRRFLNAHAKGDLFVAARAAELHPLKIHIMMRSGQITENTFAKLATGLNLSREAREASKAPFVFASEHRPSPSTGEDLRWDLFTHHLKMASEDGLSTNSVGLAAPPKPNNTNGQTLHIDASLSTPHSPSLSGAHTFRLTPDFSPPGHPKYRFFERPIPGLIAHANALSLGADKDSNIGSLAVVRHEGTPHLVTGLTQSAALPATQLNLLTLSRNLATGVRSFVPTPVAVIPSLTPRSSYVFVNEPPSGTDFEAVTIWGMEPLYWDQVLAQSNDGEHLGEWLHQSFIDPFDLNPYSFVIHRTYNVNEPYREQVAIYRTVADSENQAENTGGDHNPNAAGLKHAEEPNLQELGPIEEEQPDNENPTFDAAWQYARSQEYESVAGTIYILIYEPGRGWVLFACTHDLFGCLELLRQQTKTKFSESIVLPPTLELTSIISLDAYMAQVKDMYQRTRSESKGPVERMQWVLDHREWVFFDQQLRPELRARGWLNKRREILVHSALRLAIVRDPITKELVVSSQFRMALSDERANEVVVSGLTLEQIEALYDETHSKFLQKMRSQYGPGDYAIVFDTQSGPDILFQIYRSLGDPSMSADRNPPAYVPSDVERMGVPTTDLNNTGILAYQKRTIWIPGIYSKTRRWYCGPISGPASVRREQTERIKRVAYHQNCKYLKESTDSNDDTALEAADDYCIECEQVTTLGSVVETNKSLGTITLPRDIDLE